MDDTKTQPLAEEQKEETIKPVEDTVTIAVSEEQKPAEEPQKEIKAPEKTEEIEAPKEKLIEAKEEDGKTKETSEEKPILSSPSDNAKWYIIHTYSGHENKVSKSLRQRVESMGF